MASANHIVVYSVGYLLFFAMLLLSKSKQGNRLLDEKGTVSNGSMLLWLHVTGILLLGVLPFYFLTHRLPEIVVGKNPVGDVRVLLPGLLVIIAVIIAPVMTEKKIFLLKKNKPLTGSFSTGFLINYFPTRILFLCAYEIWFRGYLLSDCINSWGIAVAIPVNIILYVLLHSVNGKDEMWACLPFGLLLCFLCVWAGAAWPAIAVHIALALSYEVHLIKRINKLSISFA